MDIIGRVHSVETFGAVDGPGIRFVAFLQGCPLRCLYCHNPDSWLKNGGTEMTTTELVDQIKEYCSFIVNGGGVTLSGGEPLFQSEFAAEVLRQCKELGFHTAIDTAGSVPLEKALPVLNHTDLVLLDIKDLDEANSVDLCGASSAGAIDILNYCEEVGKDVWIRHVLLLGYTLKEDKLYKLANFIKSFSCVSRVELLPFHKMGEFKYKELGLPYHLKDTPEPTPEQVEKCREIFRLCGLKVQ